MHCSVLLSNCISRLWLHSLAHAVPERVFKVLGLTISHIDFFFPLQNITTIKISNYNNPGLRFEEYLRYNLISIPCLILGLFVFVHSKTSGGFVILIDVSLMFGCKR